MVELYFHCPIRLHGIVQRENNFRPLILGTNLSYVISHKLTSSLIFSVYRVYSVSSGSILLSIVRCGIQCKGDGLRLIIYASYVCEMVLNVGLIVSVDNM
jgi:hypothetical protein